MKFELKEEYTSVPADKLITYLVGEKEPFTLDSKPFVVQVPASKEGPAYTKTIPVATQKQLKKLADIGHMVQEVKS